MRIVITAGGTGGHIFPAIAIIKKLKELYKDVEILYIGTTDRMESSIIPNMNIDYVGIEMIGLNRKNILKNFKTIKCLYKGIKKAKKTLQEFKPDFVLGVGGYITVPVLYAASKLKIKCAIHEQNAIAGLSNKLLSKKVDKVFVSIEESKKYFDEKKVIYTGNPRSEEIINAKKQDKKDFKLDPNKKLVIITMGSLGSYTINNKMKEILKAVKNKNYQVLYISGKSYYEEFKKEKDIPNNVVVCDLIEDWLGLLKNCDVLVSRAGATTIAEITAVGLASILIPSPYVTNNHQMKNAMALKNKNACYILEEEELNTKNLLDRIDEILNKKEKALQLRTNAKKMRKEKSATIICEEIKKLVEE